MTDKKPIKEMLYDWAMRNHSSSLAEGIVQLWRIKNVTMSDLNSISLDDLLEIHNKVESNREFSERFEVLIDLQSCIAQRREAYEEGLLSLPGMVTQMDFLITSYVRNTERLGSCLMCKKDEKGIMEFICNECLKSHGREAV